MSAGRNLVNSSLKPYIVLVDSDTDYLISAKEFIDEHLRGYTVFLASSPIEAISTMHHLNGPAVFLVEYDLPDMNGLTLIAESIRKMFLFDSCCNIVTDNVTQEVEDACAAANVGYFPKSRQLDDNPERRIYNLDIFYRGMIKRGIYELRRTKAARTKDVFAGIFKKEDGTPLRWSRDYKRARMYRTPTSAIFADLNGLKFVNDTYGHAAGDLLIEAFLEALHTHIRERDKFDYIIRWGAGDEFVIILPETRPESARGVRTRIANHLKTVSVKVAPGVQHPLSVAMGVSTVSWNMLMNLREDEALAHLVNSADEAMYRNKLSMKAAKAKSLKSKTEAESRQDPHPPLPIH